MHPLPSSGFRVWPPVRSRTSDPGDRPCAGIAHARADNSGGGDRQDDRRTLTATQPLRILVELEEAHGPVDVRTGRADRFDDRIRCLGSIGGAAGTIGERDHDASIAFEHASAILSAATGPDDLDDVREPRCRHDGQRGPKSRPRNIARKERGEARKETSGIQAPGERPTPRYLFGPKPYFFILSTDLRCDVLNIVRVSATRSTLTM